MGIFGGGPPLRALTCVNGSAHHQRLVWGDGKGRGERGDGRG